MKFLFCSLASHGFVFPAVAVARELTARGHEVAFVTGASFAPMLSAHGLRRIPRGPRDGASFEIKQWFYPLAIAMQVKHIDYALEHFAADVLVGQPLTIGPLLARERHRLPLALLGLANHLLPTPRLFAREPDSPRANRLLWRLEEFTKIHNQARQLFKMEPLSEDCRQTSLLGDLLLLQSVPEYLEDPEDLPESIRLVGSCLWEPEERDRELSAWLDEAVATDEIIIYAQLGRTFENCDPWAYLVAALKDRAVRVVVSIGRTDCIITDVPSNFFARDFLPMGQILPRARLIIHSGNTTSTLGALTHGVPGLILHAGGEQEESAERCEAAGVGISIPAGQLSLKLLREAIARLRDDPSFRQRAGELRQAFRRVDGPKSAAGHLEGLATERHSEYAHAAS